MPTYTFRNTFSATARNAVVAAALLISAASASAAAGDNLFDELLPAPDIANQSIFVTYDNGTFFAEGSATKYDAGGSTYDISDGFFSINAAFSSGMLDSGTVGIEGAISDLGLGVGTSLLTGDLTDAMGLASGGEYQFLFAVTGGELMADYGGSGAIVGIKLTGAGLPTTGFSENFDVFSANADVAPVPVPAAVWLFGSALLGLAGFVRRRRA